MSRNKFVRRRIFQIFQKAFQTFDVVHSPQQSIATLIPPGTQQPAYAEPNRNALEITDRFHLRLSPAIERLPSNRCLSHPANAVARSVGSDFKVFVIDVQANGEFGLMLSTGSAAPTLILSNGVVGDEVDIVLLSVSSISIPLFFSWSFCFAIRHFIWFSWRSCCISYVHFSYLRISSPCQT